MRQRYRLCELATAGPSSVRGCVTVSASSALHRRVVSLAALLGYGLASALFLALPSSSIPAGGMSATGAMPPS